MKLALALFALMLAIAGVSFFAWRAAPVPAPCVNRDVSSSTAPDGKSLAEVFTQQCGEHVATHVSLRPAGSAVPMRSDVIIFADTPPVALLWNDEHELVVQSPAERVLVEESGWRNVRVQLRRVR
ncbi:MAG TPA: hypothetical protein VLW85_07770 [Myxococcales bacterium]|nr:hypothetical protein [Myxococcales bacterium]